MYSRFPPFLGLLMALSLAAAAGEDDGRVLPVYDGIGGDFSAESTLGREVRLSELRGKVVLVFFGYTSCLDVCPATLAHLKSLVADMGSTADRVQVLFVTIDPEVDTVEHLKAYLANFDPRFVGLTGGRDEIDAIAKLFLVKHEDSQGVQVSTAYNRRKTYTEKTRLYAHSQQIFLLDTRGRTRALFFSGSPLEEMEKAIRILLEDAERASE